MTENHPRNIKIVEPFVLLLLIGAAIIYTINVFNTGNWFWFQGGTSDLKPPARIVIIDHGERIVLQPGSAGYNALSDAAVASLQKFNNTDLVSVGLSEQTLDDYANDSLVVELHFDNPVIFNTMARTGEPKQLLIPIDGRHAKGAYVFRGDQGEWWFGALRMADPQPLYSALQDLGYSAEVFQRAG